MLTKLHGVLDARQGTLSAKYLITYAHVGRFVFYGHLLFGTISGKTIGVPFSSIGIATRPKICYSFPTSKRTDRLFISVLF